jgi:hypothetical protein
MPKLINLYLTIITVFCMTVLVLNGCQDEILNTSDDEYEVLSSKEFSGQGISNHAQVSKNPAEMNRKLADLRQATATFHNFNKADESGYSVQLTPCLYHSELGGMGYHYANLALMDGSINLLEPEVLVYEPKPNGLLRLVAVEYIVPFDAWNEENPHWDDGNPPSLLGHDYLPNEEGGFYALHVWIWRQNPSGMFFDWNPKVSCEHADESLAVTDPGE